MSNLPNIYQEVEWVGSDGNQYLQTNVNIDNSASPYHFNAELLIKEFGGDQAFFGTDPYNISINNSGAILDSSPSYQLNVDTWYEFNSDTDWNHRVVYVNGNTVNLNDYGYDVRYPIEVFSQHYTDGFRKSKIKLKYLTVKNKDNNIILDLIPCYRISDNEIGMYDTVSETFFTNRGSGTFTKGPDVVSSRPIYFNSTQCSKVFFNGTELQGAKFNGNNLF